MTVSMELSAAAAQLVREFSLESATHAGAAIFGVTFDGRLLVLASRHLLVRVVPDVARFVDELETFPERGGLASDGRSLWQFSGAELQELDRRTGFVVRALPAHFPDAAGLARVHDELWIALEGARRIVRLAARDGSVLGEIGVDVAPRGLAYVDGELWCGAVGELCRLDVQTGRVDYRMALPMGFEVCDVSGDDEERLWCVDGASRVVRAFARPHDPYRQRPRSR